MRKTTNRHFEMQQYCSKRTWTVLTSTYKIHKCHLPGKQKTPISADTTSLLVPQRKMSFTSAEFASETLMESRPMGVGTVREHQSCTTACQRNKCGTFRLERGDGKQIEKS